MNQIPKGDISDYDISPETAIQNSDRPEGDIFFYYYTTLEIPIQSSHRPEGDIF